ncbi:type II secretion system protein M [Porticoccus sp. W117]|uniref:type II secretion system protein M n=1 Tax=Porticoccus sp. W117 TaxID=3054777 RepID=UPI002597001A|nr:type II secretion system protein M [Porticoccus sp. W117]MDM3872562.1 type II secretion system protein M [Porticoccus sp. W117]
MDKITIQKKYQSLDDRDRTALKVLAIFAGLLALIYGLILPAYNYYQDSKTRVTEQQELLQWVKQHSPQVKQLATTPKKQVTNQSIMEATTNTAKALGVEINRLQPEAENLRTWLTQVSFEKTIKLLTTLSEQHGIGIQQITVEKTAKPGVVNVQCLLENR